MIKVDVEQGSAEWLACRIGLATASRFDKILTPRTRELSKQADGYMHELLAEMMLGTSLDAGMNTRYMQRGSEMEPEAVRYYEVLHDVDTEVVGFVMNDEGVVGCSPDRLVGSDGGLEIKCVGATQHVANLLEMSTRYGIQAQGGMWICNRKWWDLLSYNPLLPSALVRIWRDAEFIEQLSDAVYQFLDRLNMKREQLEKLGCVFDKPIKEEAA